MLIFYKKSANLNEAKTKAIIKIDKVIQGDFAVLNKTTAIATENITTTVLWISVKSKA